MIKHIARWRRSRGAVPAGAVDVRAAGREHMKLYGSTAEQSPRSAQEPQALVNNPYAQFQDEYTLEQIQQSRMVYDPLTKLQCRPLGRLRAAILASEASWNGTARRGGGEIVGRR